MVTDMNCLEQFSALFVSIKVTGANAFRKLSIFFSFLLCGDIRFFVCLFVFLFCFVFFVLFCFFVFCFLLFFFVILSISLYSIRYFPNVLEIKQR